ncbi:Enolase [Bienertia sinuspersici]
MESCMKRGNMETLRDYCVEEGFAITVISADNQRFTATCAAECCDWRVHASKLADGRTWAIKKIWPDKHSCRGWTSNNPICTVKWAANKLMEDITSNPEIKGKERNGLLFKKYGLYMKKSSLYNLKNFIGVDLALKKVWPTAKRRYCCRHLSRNIKKAFPGPLMYILSWRACNATNPFTFKKAMERLRMREKNKS